MTSRKFVPALVAASLGTSLVFCGTTFMLQRRAVAQVPGAPAQPATSGDLLNQAKQQYDAGKYQDALVYLDKIFAEFATSEVIPQAYLLAGNSYFVLGKYDEAIAAFKKILEPPATPDIQEFAHSLLPQVTSAKASTLGSSGPVRDAAFNEAIGQYNVYIQKFPNGSAMETALYGRALCNFQLGKVAEAIPDLRANLQKFKGSPTIVDSAYLLALALSQQARTTLAEAKASTNTEEALKQLDEAENLLLEIIKSNQGLGVDNDCYFQLGEIALLRASRIDTEKKDERKKAYDLALSRYRAVKAKDALIESQQAKVAQLNQDWKAAIAARDSNRASALSTRIARENGKLEQFKTRPDQIDSARLKVGEVFYQKGDFDAARVAMDYLAKVSQDEEQKKPVLFYRTMTYAFQGIIEKAMEGFDEFQSKFPNDPMAENLPVAIGGMFLNNPDPKKNDPQKAIDFFTKALEQYPSGKLAGLVTVQKATAQVALQQYDQAAETFNAYLKNSTDEPKENTYKAEIGLANIYKDTGKFDDAIAAFTKIRDNYKEVPGAAETALFWIGMCTMQKGDFSGAITILQDYVKEYPEGSMVAFARYQTAIAQTQTAKLDDAIATYKEIIEKLPDTEQGIMSHFQLASIYSNKKQTEELVAIMNQFIEKYPKDSRVYFAYQQLAQNFATNQQLPEAVAKYAEFVEKNPDHASAPAALLDASRLTKNQMTMLGRYNAIAEDQRAKWQELATQAIGFAERVIEKYPNSPSVALALTNLQDLQKMRVESGLIKAGEVVGYFDALAAKYADQPATESKIKFSLAAYLFPTEPAKAMEVLRAAYKPDVVYAPADLDLLITAELKEGKFDEAQKIAEKLIKDYPMPEGVNPRSQPVENQTAQANYLFTMGKIAQEQKRLDDSKKFFDALRKDYSWSSKMLEANFGIAMALRAEGKSDEALPILVGVARSQAATPELQANSMLQIAHIHKGKNDPSSLAAAIDNFMKISVYYKGVPAAAAEGLWEGGQLLERQAGTFTDKKQAATATQRARKAYEDLVNNYPQSEFAEQAKRKLASMPAK